MCSASTSARPWSGWPSAAWQDEPDSAWQTLLGRSTSWQPARLTLLPRRWSCTTCGTGSRPCAISGVCWRPPAGWSSQTHHPAEDWRWFQRPDYFATEEIVDRFPLGDGTAEVRFYRRPLSAMFAAIRESGFQVDELAEPMPLQECAERHPDSYALLTTTPRFLYFRLRPEASTA